MFDNNEIRNQQAKVAEMVSAFAFFKQRGIEVARRRYPNFIDSFLQNEDKSVEQFQRYLIQTLPARAHS